MSPKEVLDFAKENGARQLDLRFTDLPGLSHHVSYPISILSDSSFEEGFGFGGAGAGQDLRERPDKPVVVQMTVGVDEHGDNCTILRRKFEPCCLLQGQFSVALSRPPCHYSGNGEDILFAVRVS